MFCGRLPKKSVHSCAKPLLVHRFQQSCPQRLRFDIHIVHMDSNELSTLSTGLSTTQAEFSTEQTNETGLVILSEGRSPKSKDLRTRISSKQMVSAKILRLAPLAQDDKAGAAVFPCFVRWPDLQFLHNSFMIFSPCFQKNMV